MHSQESHIEQIHPFCVLSVVPSNVHRVKIVCVVHLHTSTFSFLTDDLYHNCSHLIDTNSGPESILCWIELS